MRFPYVVIVKFVGGFFKAHEFMDEFMAKDFARDMRNHENVITAITAKKVENQDVND